MSVKKFLSYGCINLNTSASDFPRPHAQPRSCGIWMMIGLRMARTAQTSKKGPSRNRKINGDAFLKVLKMNDKLSLVVVGLVYFLLFPANYQWTNIFHVLEQRFQIYSPRGGFIHNLLSILLSSSIFLMALTTT